MHTKDPTQTVHISRGMTKPTKWLCDQRRLISAWASAQSDQSLRCALSAYLRTQGIFMWTAKTLIRLGECPGWSESSLGAYSNFWFCHVAAHMCSQWCFRHSTKTFSIFSVTKFHLEIKCVTSLPSSSDSIRLWGSIQTQSHDTVVVASILSLILAF